MTLLFPIALGGAIGAALRYILNAQITALWGGGFPLGIMVVNILGSFVMGCIAGGVTAGWTASPELRAFLSTGVLGGFTTFSAFSLDTAVLIERGDLGHAALYVGGSVALSIAGLFLGLYLIRTLGS
jgi:CrcB protein